LYSGLHSGWGVAARLAWRDLRGGVSGLPILIGCLALGVAVIAAVGSLSNAIEAGLQADARTLLGGDIAVRRPHRALDGAAQAWVENEAVALTNTISMRAMAEGGERRALVELKAVDGAYPNLGAMELKPAMPLAEALADNGAVAETALLARLGIAIGDTLRVGDAELTIRAEIVREPDRLASVFSLGPRLMVDEAGLAATGLVLPGSLIRYYTKLLLPPGGDPSDFVTRFADAFPEGDWRVRTSDQAQPGLRTFINRLTLYLVLIGLTALLVGGVGVAGAARGHLESRTATIATLKCLGATPRLIFRTYLLQTIMLAAVGVGVGVLLGAGMPWVIGPLVADRLPVAAKLAIYPIPLVLAATFGFMSALLFTIWPLARAGDVPAGGLFRHVVTPPEGLPAWRYVAATVLLAAAFGVLVIFTAGDKIVGLWFVGGAAVSMAVFRLSGWLLTRFAGRLARHRRGTARFALGNLGRPGAATPSTVQSLGIGLAVLVAITLIEGNLQTQVTERVPEEAPAFFFIDIQRDQADGFATLVEGIDGVDNVEKTPMLRGRITAINGTPSHEAKVAPGSRWLLRSDIGFTTMADRPARANVVEGEWWPADYHGAPIVSLGEEAAHGLGVKIGERLTYNILGRTVEAEVANLRRIDWGDLGINFVNVLAPGVLDGAPYAYVATARATEAAEAPLLNALGEHFPNISAIPVRAVLAAMNQVIGAIGSAIGATAGVTLLTSMLVLAGVIAAGRQARIYDSVVLKVLGATRGDVLRAYVLEYAVLGLVAGALAAAIGSLAAWAFVTQLLDVEWTFFADRAGLTVLASILITTALGFLGTWRALGQKPAPVLRTP
jgi:putative ABC transport system permease protein